MYLEIEAGPGVLSPAFNKDAPSKNCRCQGHNREIMSVADIACLWHCTTEQVCVNFHWINLGPISFSNASDCALILFSECSIGFKIKRMVS